jgi:hypothetical protein
MTPSVCSKSRTRLIAAKPRRAGNANHVAGKTAERNGSLSSVGGGAPPGGSNHGSTNSIRRGEITVDFEYSSRTKALLERLDAFMDEWVYPNEEKFHQEVATGDRWQPTKIMESQARGPQGRALESFSAGERTRRRPDQSRIRPFVRADGPSGVVARVVVQTLEDEPIRGLEAALDHAASTAFQISGAVLCLTRSLSSLN